MILVLHNSITNRKVTINMDKCVHIISHSHWDREWYLPFEQHRMRLIELVDKCMELFESDSEFKSFHMDGQTIVLDDYLEIRPENREKIINYVKEGKLVVGPWYILQDEFLTSGESNVRNLLVGMKEAEKYGGVCKVGYFPDAFGNAGQMPQLLKQAGMDAVVFGRGVKPVGFDNEVGETGAYESPYSEIKWQSPDGSELMGILFANWYNNGNEVPTDEETAKAYWEDRIPKAEKFASTNQLLMMNGCDHQPVQADISKAIETAKKLYPNVEFKHSNFPDYVKAIADKLPDNLATIKGEITSQHTDGWVTLVNTTSSRIYLKQMNRKCESALENIAEPMCVMSLLFGKKYPAEELIYSWKVLMQNHPHDSICGCSIDEVNAEMATRFNKSKQVADYLTDEAMAYIAKLIDTSVFKGKGVKPFAVFNTTGRKRNNVVSVDINIEESKPPLRPSAEKMDTVHVPEYILIDGKGNEVPCKVEDMGVTFGYDLPKDKFRQPYMARTVRVTFEACDVPAMGYKAYALLEGKSKIKKDSLVTAENCMENENIKVEILSDGSYNLTDKKTGYVYRSIGYYEETGDLGNEYIYKMPNNTQPIITRGTPAEIELEEDLGYRAVYKITNRMTVPKSGDETFEYEKQHMVDFRDRKGGRSEETVDLVINTYLTLEKHGKGLKVKTVFDNTAKDHRVRIMVPTGINSDVHKADSVFEVVTRNNRHNECWQNPSGCEHQQGFVSIDDGKAGIAVANIGLYEYEMLADLDNTIAVTILRATGEMGDWGVFPTPEAQVQGISETEIEIIPHSGSVTDNNTHEDCYSFRVDMPVVNVDLQRGVMPCEFSMFDWDGDGLTLTGLKKKEDSNDIIVRWVNVSDKPAVLTVKQTNVINSIYRSNVIEEKLEDIKTNENGCYSVKVRPQEIITLGIVR